MHICGYWVGVGLWLSVCLMEVIGGLLTWYVWLWHVFIESRKQWMMTRSPSYWNYSTTHCALYIFDMPCVCCQLNCVLILCGLLLVFDNMYHFFTAYLKLYFTLQWMLLDDLFEQERHIRAAMANRAGVLGLLLHQTIDHDPLHPLKTSTWRIQWCDISMFRDSEALNAAKCY